MEHHSVEGHQLTVKATAGSEVFTILQAQMGMPLTESLCIRGYHNIRFTSCLRQIGFRLLFCTAKRIHANTQPRN